MTYNIEKTAISVIHSHLKGFTFSSYLMHKCLKVVVTMQKVPTKNV